MHKSDLAALQSGSGGDDLTVVAAITMQSEESLVSTLASVRRQEASAGGQAAPKMQEEVKKEEDKVELPLEVSQERAPIEEKKLEKKVVGQKPSTPAPATEAEDEKRAAGRLFEARRAELLSIYNSRVYQALMKNALRPHTAQKGRVVVELTLAPSGELLDHHVVQSSGSPTLDKTAMSSLERAAPFPPVPPEAGKESHTLRVPFEYALK